MDELINVAHGLHRTGFLDEQGFCLAHGDLEPYNLLIKIQDKENVKISAVLDWDSAIFAPSVVAYKVPYWLWLPDTCCRSVADDEASVNIEPSTEHERELKQIFMETAADEPMYSKYAFAPEAIIARKLFDVLQNSLEHNWELNQAKEVIREWKEMHMETWPKELSGSEPPSDSDLDSSDSDSDSDSSSESDEM
jgi:hypothetical protein